MARTASTKFVGGLATVLGTLAATAATGCERPQAEPALSKPAEDEEIKELPRVPANGPKLGAVADITPVFDAPPASANKIGYLHAGAKVARTEEPISKTGCEGGWYPIRPRGLVCNGTVATTDLSHPTLTAMALQPKLAEPLPYTYARTTKSTDLLKRDPAQENAVAKAGKLPRRSGMAIVGSWSALDPEGKMQRLGMLTNGLFAKAVDLKAAEPSTFAGVELNQKQQLPVGFVVKQGVRAWRVEKDEAEKTGKLDYHQVLPLTGRFRTTGGYMYWAMEDGRYARHRDVTVVRRRNTFPDFAQADQKWIDISIITGTAVLYEGRRPVFTTLVSVGRDRLGDPKESASTAQGVHRIVGKHITAAGLKPEGLAENFQIYDLPWVMELSSGQLMHGAFWHSRFGIEHGPGHIQLAPSDARRVWHWVTPSVPEGWHGVSQVPTKPTIVNVRK